MSRTNKFKKLGIMVIAIFCILTGCTQKSVQEPLPQEPSTTVPDEPLVEQENRVYKAQIEKFDIGGRAYKSSVGVEMPYRLRGVMALPEEEGVFPLVLMIHGSHDNEHESMRFDTGFEYLVTALAEKGYIAISLDMQQAYVWKYGDNDDNEKIRAMFFEHLKALEAASKGEEVGYTTDLNGKVDWEYIGLIGHSRGGDTIFDIANDQIKAGKNIKSILSIAPAIRLEERQWPDVDTALLVPQYDGDVSNLDGYRIYDQIKQIDHNRYLSLILLEKANHNYFNTQVVRNDVELLGAEYEDQLERMDQEKFLRQFAGEFFDATLKEKLDMSTHRDAVSLPNTLYGYDVRISTDAPTRVSIVDLEEYGTLRESWFYKNDEIPGFYIPPIGEVEEKGKQLLGLNWEQLGRTVSFTSQRKDLSMMRGLSIEIAQDSSNELNEPGIVPSFTLQLRDGKGKSANVTIKNEAALRYIEGELDMTEIDETKHYFWTKFTPLADIQVPLSKFIDINLKDITEIVFLFDQTPTGALWVESINVY